MGRGRGKGGKGIVKTLAHPIRSRKQHNERSYIESRDALVADFKELGFRSYDDLDREERELTRAIKVTVYQPYGTSPKKRKIFTDISYDEKSKDLYVKTVINQWGRSPQPFVYKLINCGKDLDLARETAQKEYDKTYLHQAKELKDPMDFKLDALSRIGSGGHYDSPEFESDGDYFIDQKEYIEDKLEEVIQGSLHNKLKTKEKEEAAARALKIEKDAKEQAEASINIYTS